MEEWMEREKKKERKKEYTYLPNLSIQAPCILAITTLKMGM